VVKIWGRFLNFTFFRLLAEVREQENPPISPLERGEGNREQ